MWDWVRYSSRPHLWYPKGTLEANKHKVSGTTTIPIYQTQPLQIKNQENIKFGNLKILCGVRC